MEGGALVTVLLSTADAQYAHGVLAAAGIVGSDARTCLAAATAAAPNMRFAVWVASLRGRSPESLAAEYGADGVRAAIVLSRSAGS